MKYNASNKTVSMTEREYEELSEAYIGVCLFCGKKHSQIEPDARKDECTKCHKLGVYGLEEIMLMGRVFLK
jgi:hypothetical protein